MLLLKYVVAHVGEKSVLELCASTLFVMNPHPQNFVMRSNTIRLHHSWYLVSLTIQNYTILQLFTKKVSFTKQKSFIMSIQPIQSL